ncbi:MAG TPA: hypothetical protein EYQ73_05035 [Candidatus Poseidoniales archaeon]|nr:MAG: hypothetical protein CXT71_05455 [Euryarchaeota archaeon]HIF46142.1 hypothetical protein [Candidatus Poseidoniales archaeon]HIL65072.1 hypothetical protein [Candidatus Poseidoniales archaeon]
MPGSPYLDQPPKGLLTWPKLLSISVPTISVLSVVAWSQDLLLEWLIFLALALIIFGMIRK